MYYANYDESTGKILGFYSDEIHKEIPTPYIELTDEEWQEAINGFYHVVDGVLTEDVFEVTIEDKIDQAQIEYQVKFSELQKQYLVAELNNKSEVMAEIKSRYAALLSDFENYVAYLKGEAPRDVGGISEIEYCPICGSELNENACAQCNWRRR